MMSTPHTPEPEDLQPTERANDPTVNEKTDQINQHVDPSSNGQHTEEAIAPNLQAEVHGPPSGAGDQHISSSANEEHTGQDPQAGASDTPSGAESLLPSSTSKNNPGAIAPNPKTGVYGPPPGSGSQHVLPPSTSEHYPGAIAPDPKTGVYGPPPGTVFPPNIGKPYWYQNPNQFPMSQYQQMYPGYPDGSQPPAMGIWHPNEQHNTHQQAPVPGIPGGLQGPDGGQPPPYSLMPPHAVPPMWSQGYIPAPSPERLSHMQQSSYWDPNTQTWKMLPQFTNPQYKPGCPVQDPTATVPTSANSKQYDDGTGSDDKSKPPESSSTQVEEAETQKLESSGTNINESSQSTSKGSGAITPVNQDVKLPKDNQKEANTETSTEGGGAENIGTVKALEEERTHVSQNSDQVSTRPKTDLRHEESDDTDNADTIIVKGIEGISTDSLEMFFESKKRSGGGPIKSDITVIEEGRSCKAVIIFEDPQVATRVLNQDRPLVLEDKTLTVEPPPKDPEIDPFSILVKGIHPSVTHDALEMFFESEKKSRGGDITFLPYQPGMEEVVCTFNDPEVAERVLSFSQEKQFVVQNCKLKVYPRIISLETQTEGTDVDKASDPVDPTLAINEGIVSNTPETDLRQEGSDDPVNADTIIVKGIEGISKDALEMFFESKKRSGGGPFKSDITIIEDGRSCKAVIIFEDPQVATRVLNEDRPLVLDDKTLTVEPPPKAPEIDPFSILVKGINPSVSRDALEMFFESEKKSRGGDIKFLPYEPGMAEVVCTFNEPKVAERVLSFSQEKPFVVQNCKLEVYPRIINLENQADGTDVDKASDAVGPKVVETEGNFSTRPKTDLRHEGSDDPVNADTIIVKGIKGISKDALEMFFESKKRSGGGSIKSDITIIEDGSSCKAVIIFEDPQVATRVLNKERPLVLEEKTLTVEPPPKAPEVDPCSILVKGIHPSVSHDALEMFFESKKKSMGGDIKFLPYEPGMKEVVCTFNDPKVAERVLSFSQETPFVVQNCKLEVYPRIVNLENQADMADADQVPEPVDPTVVIIEGIGRETLRETLMMFLENEKKSGGGDDEVEDLKYDAEKHTAVVKFKSVEVAQRVLQRGKVELEKSELTLHAPVPPAPIKTKQKTSNDPMKSLGMQSMQPFEADSLQEVDTLEITKLGKIGKEHLRMFLENPRESGGGEMTSLKIIPERNSAIVTFRYQKDAQNILKKPNHIIDGNICGVFPLNTNALDAKQYHGPLAVCVTGLTSATSEEEMQYFFQNRRKSGGGDILKLYHSEDKGKAVITFKNDTTVSNVLAKHESGALTLCKAELSVERLQPPFPPRHITGPTEPFKLFITEAPDLLPEDLLAYFVDLPEEVGAETGKPTDGYTLMRSSVKDVSLLKKIFYSPRKRTIMLELKKIVDYESLLEQCALYPINDHMITLQQVALPTHVQVHNVDPKLGEMLELYFQDGKSGGDENVTVKDEDQEERYVILDCLTPKVVKSIMQKGHKLKGITLVVNIFYPDFGIIPPSCDLSQAWNYIPKPYWHKIHQDSSISSYMEQFLQSSEEAKSLFCKIGEKSLFVIDWNKTCLEGLFVMCHPDFKNQAKQKNTWEEQTKCEIDKLLGKITVSKIYTLEELFDQIHEEAVKITDKQAYLAVEKEQSLLFIVGWATIVEKCSNNLELFNKKMEERVMRKKKSIEETLKLKSSQETLLRAHKFPEELQRRYPNLVLKFLSSSEMYFKGLPDEVKNAKLSIFEEIINKVSSEKCALSPRKSALLRLNETRKHIINNSFNKDSIIAVMDIGVTDVTFHCLNKDDIQKAHKIVEAEIKDHEVKLVDENLAVLQMSSWKGMIALQRERYKGILQIDEDPENKKVFITCISTVFDVVTEELVNCLKENTIHKQFVCLETGRLRLLTQSFQNETDQIQNNFKSCMVKIQPSGNMDKGSGFVVSGSTHGLTPAVSALKNLATKVLRKDHTISRPGMFEYFNSPRGKEYLMMIEPKYSVACQIMDPNQAVEADESFAGSSSRSQGSYMIQMENGNVVCIIQGDMTKHKVGAIVNAANSSLRHSGGLAEAILSAGGMSIQDECNRHVNQHGEVKTGEVFVGKDHGKLPCDIIIHAVGPRWDRECPSSNKNKGNELYSAITSSLEEADKQELTSIAIPAVSTGIYGFPLQEATDTICQAVLNYLMGAHNTLSEVHLMDNQEITVKSFKESLIKVIRDNDINVTTKQSAAMSTADEDFEMLDMPGSSMERTGPLYPTRNKSYVMEVPAGDTSGPSVAAELPGPPWKKGPNNHSIMTQEGLLVSLIKSSIVKEKADVIVNTTNRELSLNNGVVSALILKLAGEKIQRECAEFAPGGASFSQVVKTSSGNIKHIKAIYHGACEGWNGGASTSIKILKTFVRNCLTEAENDGFTSIAMPAIGTGNLEFPRDKVSEYMFEEILAFSKSSPQSCVKDVRIILYDGDKPTVQAFETHLDKLLAECTMSTSTPVRPKQRNLVISSSNTRGKEKGQGKGHDAKGQDKGQRQNDERQAGYKEFTEEKDRFVISIANVTVTMQQGDITEETTDAIVNSTNSTLDLNIGAVSQAIVRKGGREIIKECKALLKRNYGRIKDLAITSSGRLKCKRIIHMDAGYSSDWVKKVRDTLLFAEKKKLKSIAFPAIGTGEFGMSSSEMAEIMLKAIAKFVADDSPMYLDDIRIIIFDKKMYKAFTKQAKDESKGKGSGILKKMSGAWQQIVKVLDYGFGGRGGYVSDDQDDTPLALHRPHQRTLLLRIYAMSEEALNMVVDKVEQVCDDETTKRVIDTKDHHQHMKQLTSEQVAWILSLETLHQVDIKVDNEQNSNLIQIEGRAKVVADCVMEIQKILNEVEREIQHREQADELIQWVQWEFKNGDQFDPYPADLNKKIEDASKRKDNNVTWEESGGEKYCIVFDTNEEECVTKPGDKVTVRRRTKNEAVAFPDTWAPMKDGEVCSLIQLNTADQEYQQVLQDFSKTYNANTIVKIERVQNPTLYKQYQVKKESMEKANTSGKDTERTLYHGTSEDTVKMINATGFNRSYCGKNATVHGNGVYFARDAEYSARSTYSPPSPQGHKHVYQCKVLTGEYTTGEDGLLAPPAKDTADPSILFDSVANNTGPLPDIFVIFHDTQAYPEYLITFT